MMVAIVAGVRLWEERKQVLIEAPASAEQTAKAKKPRGYGRTVTIEAAANQQYYVEAKVNNRRMKFLVDTGAVFVAIRQSDLQRAGVLLDERDFTHGVSTANGHTRAARVRIDMIEVGGVLISDVDAFVLPDNQLGINLLGMSFLSQLSSVETRNGEMVLKQ